LKNLIGQIRGLIVKKLKFDSQIGVWLKKLKTSDQIIKTLNVLWSIKSPNA
jgi:hypothetical protein